MNRKKFLRTSLVTTVALLGSRFLRAATATTAARTAATLPAPAIDPPAGFRIGDAPYPIVDLHCHPSLKMYLWQEHLWGKHFPAPGTNTFPMQLDTRELSHGFVKGMLGAHYLVEAATVREWNLLGTLYPWIKRLWHPLANKIEHEDASNFTQINIMIDTLENQVYLVNQRQQQIQFVIATDFDAFRRAAEAPGQIAIAHAIEGGHALGRKFPVSEKRKQLFLERPSRQHKMSTQADGDPVLPYIRNLETLHARGVCLMAIAHLFANDLAHPSEGISEDEKSRIGMKWHYRPEQDNIGLSEVGKAVVKRMLEIGMIVDLTHSTPAGRQDVYDIAYRVNDIRKSMHLPPRPLVFTHVGLQSIFTKYDHRPELQNYKFYDIDPAEIDAICACDGVIGVIPENFWLTGADRKIQGNGIEPGNYRDGIRYIIETMIAINELTPKKDFSNIGIGTDFDGLADAPRDLFVPRQLGALIDAIRAIPGINEDRIQAITSQNAYRVLKRGWGHPMNIS